VSVVELAIRLSSTRGIARLEAAQALPVTIDEAWAFFSDPSNLASITPPSLDFVVTSDLPARVYAGLIVSYTVRPVLGVRTVWVTEITQVRAPHFFVDEQRIGPYRLWHHEHHLESVPGGVVVRDVVHYRAPGGPLAGLLDRFVVRPRLHRIFTYRREALERRFGRVE